MKLAIYNLLILLLIPIFQLRILLKSYSDKGTELIYLKDMEEI